MDKAVKRLADPPQTEPVLGREGEMEAGYEGGYLFKMPWEHELKKWLVLGNNGDTFYASEQEANYDMLKAVFGASNFDWRKALQIIAEYRTRIPRPKNAVGAYALLSVMAPEEVRRYTYQRFGDLAWNGSDLLYFMKVRKAAGGGFGAGLRKAVRRYYSRKGRALIADVVKYKQRWGNWSQRDVLRVVHPRPTKVGPWAAAAFKYATRGFDETIGCMALDVQRRFWLATESAMAFENKVSKATDWREVVEAIEDYEGVVWEVIPTKFLADVRVWFALITKGAVGHRAILRNVARFVRHGHFSSTAFTNAVVDTINLINDGGPPISPMSIFLPLAIMFRQVPRGYEYVEASDDGLVKRSSADTSSTELANVGRVAEALEGALMRSFDYGSPLKPGKYVVGIDTSGSMNYTDTKIVVPPAVQAMGLAWIIGQYAKRSEGVEVEFCGVDSDVHPLRDLTDFDLGTVLSMETDGWATHLEKLPKHLKRDGKHIDGLLMMSDNQTYGASHYFAEVEKLRKAVNLELRSVSVDMMPYRGSISDPRNPKDLAVIGFDPGVVDVAFWHLNGGE